MPIKKVAQFAAELKMPADLLLKQLQAAGLEKHSANDHLSKEDKDTLLGHLRRAHGISSDSEKRKITLTRKDSVTNKQPPGDGKSRTIQVEVRKKKVFDQDNDKKTRNALMEQNAGLLISNEIEPKEGIVTSADELSDTKKTERNATRFRYSR